MTNNNKPVPFYLIGKYLQNSITNEEAGQLYQELESNESTRQFLKENMLVHLWLNEFFVPQQKSELPPGSRIGQEDPFREPIAPLFPTEFDPNLNTPVIRTDPIEVKADGSIHRSLSKKSTRDGARWKNRGILFGGIASLFLFFVLFVSSFFMQSGQNRGNSQEPALARIVEVLSPVWKDENDFYKRGQELNPCKLFLQSGQIRLEFRNGADLILEGPNEFIINDEGNVFCNSGRLSATIPESAYGFSVITPYARFIDRGTKFVIDVSNAKARLDVIKGSVDVLHTCDSSPLNVLTGEAVQASSRKISQKLNAETERFLSSKKFLTAVKIETERKLSALELEEQRWNEYPGLYLRFDLGQIYNNRVEDLSHHPERERLFASFTNSSRTSGALHGTTALAFHRKKAHGSLKLPREFQSATLFLTVRLDDLRRDANILMMSDRFYDESGGINWQITKEGMIQAFLSHKIKESAKAEPSLFAAQKTFDLKRKKTWISLALVFDADEKKISHYLDGKIIGSLPWEDPTPIRLGDLTIGNKMTSDGDKNDRPLDGAIGELQIYQEALSPEKIFELNRIFLL